LKILILHQHFKSPETGGAIRSYYLAKALLEKGHEVIVLTGHSGKYKHENLEGLSIHWLNVPYDNSFSFKQRGASFLKFVWQVTNNPQLYLDCDLCYAISVPLTTGMAALWIKKKFKIPFLFEVGDLWPDAPVEMGILQNKVLASILFGLEKRIYKNALSIVALSQPIKESIEKKTGGKKQVHVIPNMADTEFYTQQRDTVLKLLNLNVEDKFVVSYIGAIGLANGLDYFLECARASQRNELPVLFIMCGEGAMLQGLVKHAQSLEL
jgi:glycosyltransferase involved in cell wall biosynthesis